MVSVPGAMACMDGKRHHRLVKEGKTHMPCTECFNPQDPHPKLPMSNRQSWSMDFFWHVFKLIASRLLKSSCIWLNPRGSTHVKKKWSTPGTSCWYQAYDHSQTAIPVKTFSPHRSAGLKSAGKKPSGWTRPLKCHDKFFLKFFQEKNWESPLL